MNKRIDLDGLWEFQIDPTRGNDATQITSWRTATVPMPWQAQFDDLHETSGVGWYRRTVTLAEGAGENAAILHFGAVNYHATVWVNGRRVGEHEGGYLPFEFDIAPHLQPGDNVLLVRVLDPDSDRATTAGMPFEEVPHGKQSWYGPIGGIWQSVWLELRPRLHIVDLALLAAPADGSVQVRAQLSQAPGSAQLHCTLLDPSGAPVANALLQSDGGNAQGATGTLRPDHAPQLWSLESPALYTVSAALVLDGAELHSTSKRCGFRSVESRDGRIYLNGAPVYLRAVLDQGYFAETIYTPPSRELLIEQARTIKAMGFNCLRIHIKVEDPRYYDVADEVGLLVWTEIPNWVLLTEDVKRRARETFIGMLARDGHHPSIFAWTLINENWGTDLTRDPAHRRWLADFTAEAKQLDPTRLIVDNSACHDNAHVAGDLDDFHWYRVQPDHAQHWDEWVADFATRASWAWYQDYAQNRRGDLPLLVSEFGNWGLPDPAEIHEAGKEPWWFETGHGWDDGQVYPHGVELRYVTSGLATLFPTFNDFARASQLHMVRSLHYEISTMRLHDAVGGYVVTEMTDVQWEPNGMLTMARKPKEGTLTHLAAINQDKVVVLRPQRWSGKPGDCLPVIVAAKGIDGAEAGGQIVWRAGSAQGALAAPGGTIEAPLAAPGMVTLEATWQDEAGATLAVNQVELACVQAPAPTATLRVLEEGALAAGLRALGYGVEVGLEGALGNPATIVVAQSYTAALQDHLQQGGRLLLLLGDGPGDGALRLPAGRVAPREGSVWQGDWANTFAWIHKQGQLAHIPGGPLLEMEWAALMPDYVLTGINPWAMRAFSRAGLAAGWIHKTASLLAVHPYGQGKVAVTTFKLNAQSLPNDAMAAALLAGIVAELGG